MKHRAENEECRVKDIEMWKWNKENQKIRTWKHRNLNKRTLKHRTVKDTIKNMQLET